MAPSEPTASTSALSPWIAAILVAAVIEFSTDTPGLGPFYGLGPASQKTSAWCAVAIVMLALATLPRVRTRTWPRWSAVALRLAPAGAALCSFLWTAPLVSLRAGERWDAFVVLTIGGFVVLALVHGRRRVPASYVAALAVFAGIVLRATHMRAFGPHVGADMIPLVTSAVDSLLSGQSPYRWHEVPGRLPLTYYPLTVLAYVPARLLAIDLRWTNVAAQLAILVALRWAGGARARAQHSEANRQVSEGATLGFSVLFLLPSSVYFDRITTAPIAWAMLTWLLVLVGLGSRRAWLLLALAAVTTPLAALCFPFAAIVAYRLRGGRRAALELLGAGGLAALLLLPWYLWAPSDFVEGTVRWFNDLDRYPGTVWNWDRAWERYVGLGGLFWDAGRERWLKPMQAASVLLIAGLFARRSVPTPKAPAYAASAFALFMVFNPVHWPYFYQPVVMLLLAAAAIQQRPLPRIDHSVDSGAGGVRAPTPRPLG